MWRQMRRTEQPSQASTATAELQTESPAAKYNAKGAELFEQEQVQEAIEEFRRAIALDPNNASYHCNLAVAYDEVDQDDDARREYERALELNSTEPTALLYLGYLLNEHDAAEQAAALWSRLMESAPGTPEAEEAAQNLRAQQEL
jgi:Flp pilus assembly protein TadD